MTSRLRQARLLAHQFIALLELRPCFVQRRRQPADWHAFDLGNVAVHEDRPEPAVACRYAREIDAANVEAFAADHVVVAFIRSGAAAGVGHAPKVSLAGGLFPLWKLKHVVGWTRWGSVYEF